MPESGKVSSKRWMGTPHFSLVRHGRYLLTCFFFPRLSKIGHGHGMYSGSHQSINHFGCVEFILVNTIQHLMLIPVVMFAEVAAGGEHHTKTSSWYTCGSCTNIHWEISWWLGGSGSERLVSIYSLWVSGQQLLKVSQPQDSECNCGNILVGISTRPPQGWWMGPDTLLIYQEARAGFFKQHQHLSKPRDSYMIPALQRHHGKTMKNGW